MGRKARRRRRRRRSKKELRGSRRLICKSQLK
jgi:hypothetical protein